MSLSSMRRMFFADHIYSLGEMITMNKNLVKLTALFCSAAMLLAGCGKKDSNPGTTVDSGAQDSQIEEVKDNAVIGENAFIITLYPDDAPITCENFEKLVSEGFYDGLTFHRIVDGFMAQGGDPAGTGAGGTDHDAANIKGEFSSNGVENKISHQRGVISMARSNDPNSASSQFFICYGDESFLDGNYAAFGMVTEGMEVVDSFTTVERKMNGMGEAAVPMTPIIMEKVTMIEDDADGNPRVQVIMQGFPLQKAGEENRNENSAKAVKK